jgi:hypothetical protein
MAVPPRRLALIVRPHSLAAVADAAASEELTISEFTRSALRERLEKGSA